MDEELGSVFGGLLGGCAWSGVVAIWNRVVVVILAARLSLLPCLPNW